MDKKAFLFKHKRPASSEYLIVALGKDVEDARKKAVDELEVHTVDEFECVEEDIWFVE